MKAAVPGPATLKQLQQSMAQLVRAGSVIADAADPAFEGYLQTVRVSAGLKVMREVVRDWRHLLLRQGCPLTTGALLGAGCFAQSIDRYMAAQVLDPLAQGLATQFMAWVAANRDDDIASVARFEQALINVRRGAQAAPVVVYWNIHPMKALAAALHGVALPPPHPAAIYATEVASYFPQEFVIRKLSVTPGRAAASVSAR